MQEEEFESEITTMMNSLKNEEYIPKLPEGYDPFKNLTFQNFFPKTYNYSIDSFYFHTENNMALSCFITAVMWCIAFCILKDPLRRMYRYFINDNGLKLNKTIFLIDKEKQKNKFFNILHIIITFVSLTVSIPYSRINKSYEWLCVINYL
jgi:hypothetical protein